jgi:hypothetical protein
LNYSIALKKFGGQLKLHFNKDEKLLNLRNSLTYEEGNKTWAALMEWHQIAKH